MAKETDQINFEEKIETKSTKNKQNKQNKQNNQEQEREYNAYASVNEYQQLYFELNYPNGMNNLATYTIPTEQFEMIRKAKELRNIDIVDRLLRIRQDYTLPIKGFKCKLKKQQKFYDEYVLPLVQRFARQWIYEYHTISEVYSHYGFNNAKKPMFLRCEDAENIKPTEALGYEMYEIKLSTQLKQQIQKLKNEKKIDKLPDYLRKALDDVGNIKDKIILDKEQMYRSCNQRPDYDLRPKPALLRIMKALTLREFLIDLDYLNGFAAQKTSIFLTKCGTKEKPWPDTKITNMHNMVTKRSPGQCFITVPGDVSMEVLSSKLNEIFDAGKFEDVNKRILDFFGISVVFVPSETGGVNNTGVYVSLKNLEQSIISDRKVFQEFLNGYFEQVNKLNGFNDLPETEYEETNIRNSDEVLKELQFMFDTGVIGYQDLCKRYNLNYLDQLEKRKWDWENRNDIAPYYEPSQGLSPQLDKTVEQKIKIAKETKQDSQSSLDNQSNPDSNLSKNNQTKTKQTTKQTKAQLQTESQTEIEINSNGGDGDG